MYFDVEPTRVRSKSEYTSYIWEFEGFTIYAVRKIVDNKYVDTYDIDILTMKSSGLSEDELNAFINKLSAVVQQDDQ
jgi:hypothetical protein